MTKKKHGPPRRKVKLRHPAGDSPGIGGFGTDPKDSKRLLELRTIIDTEIGWDNELQMERGDYAARLREVAALLDGLGVERVTS